MPPRRKNIEPITTPALLVALILLVALLHRCGAHHEHSFAIVPMPTTGQASTDPAAVRS